MHTLLYHSSKNMKKLIFGFTLLSLFGSVAAFEMPGIFKRAPQVSQEERDEIDATAKRLLTKEIRRMGIPGAEGVDPEVIAEQALELQGDVERDADGIRSSMVADIYRGVARLQQQGAEGEGSHAGIMNQIRSEKSRGMALLRDDLDNPSTAEGQKAVQMATERATGRMVANMLLGAGAFGMTAQGI